MDSLGPQFIQTRQPSGTNIEGLSSGESPTSRLSSAPKKPAQLCLYRPDKNSHITTGVTQANFSNLQHVSERLLDNTRPLVKGERPALEKAYQDAQSILRHAGLDRTNLTQGQVITLARMLGEGIVSTDWAQRMNTSLDKGNISSLDFQSLLKNQIEAYKTAKVVVAGATSMPEAFTANETKELASLLLQGIVDNAWVDSHAKALACGALSHEDLALATDSAIDIHRASLAEAAQPKDKAKVDEAPQPSLAEKALNQAALQQLSGLHSFSSSWHTHIAKEIAKEVVGADGKVDVEKAKALREELLSESYQSSAPKSPHNKIVIRYLDGLINNENGLRDLLESIPPPPSQTSKAADKIRSTLGLPIGTEVTASHAQQAALSALLTEIRQHSYVGSCFATSVAIKSHDEDPVRFLREIKELIAHDSLTVSNERANIEVPISSSVNISALRRPITLQISEENPPIVYLKLAGNNDAYESMSLSGTPGIKAAMDALEIPESEREELLVGMARELGTKTNMQAILKNLVDSQGPKNADQKMTLAIDAFQAQESNPMLRAWEYTLAGYAGPRISNHHITSLQNAILETNIPGSEGTLREATQAVILETSSIPDRSKRSINYLLISHFETTAHKLLSARFHATSQEEAQTTESGWELCYSRDGKTIPIKTDEDMQAFLLYAWEATIDSVQTSLASPDESEENNELSTAIPKDKLLESIERSITKDGFMENIPKQAQSQGTEIHRDPQWFFASGASELEVLEHYYGNPKFQSIYSPTLPPPAQDPKKFFTKFAEKISSLKDNVGRIPEHIPCGVEGHALVIKPTDDPKLQAIIESDNPSEKVDELLLEPGRRFTDKSLSEAEIKEALSSIATKMYGSEHAHQFDEYIPDIMDDLNASNYTGKPKELRETLGRLFAPYMSQGLMNEAMLDNLLTGALKPPCITFADKNYDGASGGHEYVSALYNPLTGKVEMWDTLATGDEFTPYWPSEEFYQTTNWQPDLNPAFYPSREIYTRSA